MTSRVFVQMSLMGLLGISFLLPTSARQKAKSKPKTTVHQSKLSAEVQSALLELRQHLGPGITVKAASAVPATVAVKFQRTATAATVTAAGVEVHRAGREPLLFRNTGQLSDTTAATVYAYRGFDAPSGLVWVSQEEHLSVEQFISGDTTLPRNAHLLISPATGQVVKTVGRPQLNTARTLVLAAYEVGAPWQPVGLQLWRIEGGRMRLLLNAPLQHWYVARSKWLGSNRLWLEMGSNWDLVMGFRPRHQAVELTVKL